MLRTGRYTTRLTSSLLRRNLATVVDSPPVQISKTKAGLNVVSVGGRVEERDRHLEHGELLTF